MKAKLGELVKQHLSSILCNARPFIWVQHILAMFIFNFFQEKKMATHRLSCGTSDTQHHGVASHVEIPLIYEVGVVISILHLRRQPRRS